jgi:hypothetical protein
MKCMLKYKITVVFLFCLLFPVILQGYPISPRPLRKLISESENIVVAQVLKNIHPQEDGEEDNDELMVWESDIAILVVKEVLQGTINTDTIKVYYSAGMVCPAPPYYEDGATVIAFLNNRKDQEWYYTQALSYGVKILDKRGITIYKDRIREMQAILKLNNTDLQNSKTVDWLLRCAQKNETRWEGVYELSPDSDFMSYYDESRDVYVRKYSLSDKQILALRKTLFSTASLSYTDIGLIDLVAKENDKELLNFIIKKLKKQFNEELWYAQTLMQKIAEMSNRSDLLSIIDKINELDYFDDDYQKHTNELLRQFMDKI